MHICVGYRPCPTFLSNLMVCSMSLQLIPAFSLSNNIRSLFIQQHESLPVIDGFRALSIILIFMFHILYAGNIFFQQTLVAQLDTLPLFLTFFQFGFLGVDGFFMLSGFLISLLIFKEYTTTGNIHLKRFYMRRFLRIIPAYFLVLAITIALGFNGLFFANMLFVNNFIPAPFQFMPWTWSLAIEMQYYIALPILLMLLLSLKKKYACVSFMMIILISVIMLVVASLLASRASLITTFPQLLSMGRESIAFFNWLYDKPYNAFLSIIPGIICAYLHFYKKQNVAHFFKHHMLLSNALLIINIFFVCSLLIYGPAILSQIIPLPLVLSLYRLLFSGSLAFIALSTLHNSFFLSVIIAKALSVIPLKYIAKISYSLFLLHPLIIFISIEFLAAGPAPMTEVTLLIKLCLISIPFSLLAATLCYLLIEKPIMNLREWCQTHTRNSK